MPPESHPNHAVRRVVLPSGKTIEIVYFADQAETEVAPPPPRGDRLHVCPICDSALVFPTDWQQVGDGEWELFLRCPNCEWTGQGVFGQQVVEQLDIELDNGTQVLVRDLRHLAQANMEDEIDRFASALHAGHIWPMDF